MKKNNHGIDGLRKWSERLRQQAADIEIDNDGGGYEESLVIAEKLAMADCMDRAAKEIDALVNLRDELMGGKALNLLVIHQLKAKLAKAHCKTCDGTGSITKVDWPGETSNMHQEPCPDCAGGEP